MRRSLLTLSILLGLAAPAFAAGAETQAQQIAALEARVKALEASIAQLTQSQVPAAARLTSADGESELDPDATETSTAAADSLSEGVDAVAPTANDGAGNANAFNPAISIILNGQYARHSLLPDSYSRAGFPLTGEAGPGAQGLSLGESEIAFATNIDEKFYGQLTLAIGSENGEDSLGVEEAYIDTTALPAGFTLRAGRFFSNLGYLNNHHAHTDKFSDRPLPYQAFLGNQYGDDGVQLRWVAPTNLFVELGGEVFRGQNYPSGGAGNNGTGVGTLFAHFGGDVGVESSWLAGVSVLHSDTRGGEDGFTGSNKLYVADATWKWAPGGNTKDGGVQVRGEYFVDKRDGEYVDPVTPAFDQPWVGTRRGAYIEGVYRINRNWETGYRYDRLWADDSGPYASNYDPFRNTMMLTWRNSEFSLVRLQLSQDHPNAVDKDNVLTLQYQTALGAHGAHKF